MTGDDAARVLAALGAVGATLATAESLTGGRLAGRMTAVPGASASFRGGVVAYATELKVRLLGVPADVVARDGVVSAACARAMALGVRELTASTYGVATTGVAGPTEQEGKPVGTVYVGLAGPDGASAVALELTGDRSAVVERTCAEALAALLRLLEPQ